MPNAEEFSITVIKENTLFKALLFFYPEPYRKRFGEQMLLVLDDLYQEELESKGKIGVGFWIVQLVDLSKSMLEQHIDFLKKYGIRKYARQVLHFNRYNALGIFFLLPFMSVFMLDIALRILQWNLFRPNTLILHGLYNSPLYWFPILFTWIFLFPILAVFLNIVPLIKSAFKNKNHLLSARFFSMNLITLAVLFIALSAVALLYLHDFLPCFFKSFMSYGLGNILNTITVCRNA